MAQPYVGEIRMFAGAFAPAGWKFCDGSLLPIATYQALFKLVGTRFGGDGLHEFALPDLRGRVPIHSSSAFVWGETGGTERVALSVDQMPGHGHDLVARAAAGTTGAPGNATLSRPSKGKTYAMNTPPDTPMSDAAVGSTGRSRPHSNIQPFLCVLFIVSLHGIVPVQA